MSTRLLALNLLLAATAVVLSVQLVRILSTPFPLPPPAVPPASQAGASFKEDPAPARPSLAAYGVVATRNLFNPNRSEATAPTAQLGAAAKPVLYGVVINRETRVAYIEDPATKRVFGYKTGDTVAGGRIEQIEPDRVVIKGPEGRLEFKLKDPSKPKPAVRAPTPSPMVAPLPGVPSVPSIAPSAPGVPPPGPAVGPRPPHLRRRQQAGSEVPGAPALSQ